MYDHAYYWTYWRSCPSYQLEQVVQHPNQYDYVSVEAAAAVLNERGANLPVYFSDNWEEARRLERQRIVSLIRMSIEAGKDLPIIYEEARSQYMEPNAWNDFVLQTHAELKDQLENDRTNSVSLGYGALGGTIGACLGAVTFALFRELGGPVMLLVGLLLVIPIVYFPIALISKSNYRNLGTALMTFVFCFVAYTLAEVLGQDLFELF